MQYKIHSKFLSGLYKNKNHFNDEVLKFTKSKFSKDEIILIGYKVEN